MAGRQNPISFKTVPNRNKTQKWQQAKTYNYDGDDWGGYDLYDEYAYDDPPQPPMPQPPPQQYGQPQGFGRPAGRKNSFDVDDERRNFSAGPVMYGASSRSSGSPTRSNVSGGDYSDGRPRSRPRDFTNPEQVPAPLAMRGSPAPSSFPPRKSSVSSGSPAPEVAPMPATRKEDKELPIPPMIRPSDIYKRMEAEREKERQSMEGSRPSMDSLQREADSAQEQGRPLSSVQEDFGEPVSRTTGPPMLPSVRNMSGIGTSFLHGSSEAGQTPVATRAPAGKDPAAEILGERSETRAQPGADPASEILAERTATRGEPGADPAADILAERSATRALPGSDPAADIMAERGHDQSIAEPESGVEHQLSDLKHQPSSGYRSMVDQAFDDDSAAPPSSLSRDSSLYSQSVGGTAVSRNNSDSTAGISPIMSRVPSAATAKMQQQERDRQVPTIAEETSRRGTPTHSRNVSGGSSDLIHPGYRRSLDPPSGDNSPARTPGLGNSHARRLSQPMSAETGNAEPPAVADQGVEMMPALEPGETPASEVPTPVPLPVTGRSRAGTDYSMRESDIAREVSTSPEKNEFSPSIAQAATAEQTAFLQDHAGTPTSQWPPATPASGRSSPAKGRVREIAGKYQNIEAESRRGSTASSKSSWSNFRGSDENLPGLGPKKRTTGESALGSDLGRTDEEARPTVPSQMSFRPGLPGQWVSYAGTPGETPAPVAEQSTSRDADAPQSSQSLQEEEVPDFSPVTDKHQLTGHSPSSSQQGGFLTQAKDAGEALGASLMSTVGIGHQTRDFASKEPPAPVELPKHRATGEMGFSNAPNRPELNRGDTEASMATDIASSASSVPPTPPAKDGMDAMGAQHGQAPRQRQLQEESRPISNYFSGAVAPLQPNKGHTRDASASLELPKLGPMTNMSTDTREGDLESDRLRREIVRSLSPTTSREDDAALTQDALDAPDNMRKVEAGQPAEPAREATERPSLGLLNQRFSWEDRQENKGVLDSSPAPARTMDVPTVREPEPDPEIRPEMPYERPRSRGLHIVNPEAEDSSDDDKAPARQTSQRMLDSEEKGIVSPFTPSQENLRDGLDSRDISRDAMAADAPSPVPLGSGLEVVDSKDNDGGSETRVPSYYMQGPPDNLTLPKSPSLTQQSPIAESTSPTTPQTAIQDRSPTSPTATAANTESKPRTSTTTAPSSGKIPPFREILANKDPARRMDLYKDTRQTFADTHTGLADWLEGMLERNPEYAHIGTRLQPSATSLGAINKGHKHTPSLAKFKQLGSSFAAGGDGSGAGGVGGVRRTSTTREAAGAAAPAPPPKDAVWEQRGKDLMKNAGVLGGKAQAGAKGLLLKGRSRFGTKRESGSGGGGSEKALPPLPPPSAPTPPPPATATTARATDSSFLLPTSSAAYANSSLSSSAAPSRDPSRGPSHSRTPSTLSRTWSRLRERRSQSKSHSSIERASGGASRSRSRPGSMVLLESGDGRGELDVVDDASPVASTSVPPGLAQATPREPAMEEREADVISPWSEPEGFVPIDGGGGGGVGERNEAISPWSEPGELVLSPLTTSADGYDGAGTGVFLPERLGVLPSPTATAFSTIAEGSPTKTVRSRQGSAVSGFSAGGRGRGRQGSRVDETIQEHEGVGEREINDEADVVGEAPDEEGKTTPLETYDELQRGWGTDSDADSAVAKEVDVRPACGRMESDRDFLPSRQKTLSAPQSPRSPRGGGFGEGEEELYESTPRQAQFPARVGGEEEYSLGKARESGGEGVEKGEGREVEVDGREDSAFDVAGLREADARDQMAADAAHGRASEESRSESTGADVAATTGQTKDGELTGTSPAQDWDKRSAISSEAKFQDPEEGDDTDRSYTAHSRRSSVSSLGNAGGREAMSAQAVPAGPIGSAQAEMEETTQQQERFMNRPYRYGSERPMSYMPLGTDASGAPLQESLQSDNRPESASVDLSGMSGPPVGVLPYQEHPAMRDAEGGLPGDHGGLRSPPTAPDSVAVSAAEPVPRPRQVSAETKDRSLKRFSGFFRGRKASQSATTVYGPSPSTISDQYGLENLQMAAADAAARPETQAGSESQQAKRHSGMWDTFKRSSVVLADESRQSSVAGLPARTDLSKDTSQQPRETPPPSSNTLKKPQRAATSAAATPADPAKKKRFSTLGSLFGRSSTSAASTSRPRKLMKQPNPSREASQPHLPATSSVMTGYEAFEEARRRQAKQHPLRARSPEIGPPLQERADLTTAAIQFPHGFAPPPGGWYGPVQEDAGQGQQYRVLHSEREMPLNTVPEAFQPVEASYGRPAMPIGPPSSSIEAVPRQLHSPPMSPVGMSAGQRSFSAGYYSPAASAPPQRHMSQASNEYQLSPQVSGQSEYYQRQDWRVHSGSMSTISPVHSRSGSDGFTRPRQARVGSISEEITRQAYVDQQQQQQQQRPWAISMPPPTGGDGAWRSVSGPAWGGGEDFSSYGDYGHSHRGPYPPMQMQVPRQWMSGYSQQAPMQHAADRYPSPPHSPETAAYQQQRFYAAQGYAQPPPPMHVQGSGGSMPPSGYVGRRDEPTLGEEALGVQMRGSSYPGQEWAPGRWD